jgi:hypothetical protein
MLVRMFARICVLVPVVALAVLWSAWLWGVGLPAPATAAPHSHLVEVVSGSNINQLAVGHPKLTGFFNHRRVYALGNPTGDQVQAPKVPRATPTQIYQSYARFLADVTAGRIDSRVRAIAYDPEAWSLTPPAERRQPGAYMRLFATLAHDHGYQVLEAPGRDLMEVNSASCHKQVGETLSHAYLRCRIPGFAARDADIFEVQSQVLESTLGKFHHLLVRAAAQARQIHPGVVVLAGLSTKPPSGVASAGVMIAAAREAAKTVDGLWVNVFSSHRAQRITGGRLFHWLQVHAY